MEKTMTKWIVIQQDGRGWDQRIGSIKEPHIFDTLKMADEYIEHNELTPPSMLASVPVEVNY